MGGHALSLTLLLLLASPPSAHFLEIKKSKYFFLASFNSSSSYFPLLSLPPLGTVNIIYWELFLICVSFFYCYKCLLIGVAFYLL